MNLMFSLGMILGVLAGCAVFYLLIYRGLQRTHNQTEEQLAQVRVELEEFQTRLFSYETQKQIEHQESARERARLEAELTQAKGEKNQLQQQLARQEEHWEETQQTRIADLTRLQKEVEQLRQDKDKLVDRLGQTTSEWQRNREILEMENDQLSHQVAALERDKATLNAQLEEQQDAWEQKHLELDIQVAQAQTDMRKLETKLSAIVGGKSTAWTEQNGTPLTVQFRQLQAEKMTLQQKLSEQSAQTQALEEEIGQLMERLLRVQQDQAG